MEKLLNKKCIAGILATATVMSAIAGKSQLAFSHPCEITNEYFPIALVKQTFLKSKNAIIIYSNRPEITQTFQINGKTIETLALDERTYVGGLKEAGLHFFAQGDNGNIYCFGKIVSEYKDGKIAARKMWMFGEDTQKPSLFMPGHPKVGDKLHQEDSPKDETGNAMIVSVSETVAISSEVYSNCVKIEKHTSSGATESKYYAPNVGCIKEVDSSGNVFVKSNAKDATVPNL